MDIELEGVLTEFSPGQMEINLGYGPALAAADAAQLVKEMTREVAARRGYRATYLGRPDAMSVGSGLHVNMSLVPVSGGANALHDPAGPEGLSTLARQAIGGLIQHHEAVAGLSAPLINSYKRLMPGLIAGYWANWGLDNRFSTYRVPAERGAATRIENRMPCATASPYLAAAATLNAALLGVVDGVDCGDPQIGDADAAPNTDRHTPHTLAEALDAIEADTVLAEAMGPELVARVPRPAPPRGRPLGGRRRDVGPRAGHRLGARQLPAVLLTPVRPTECFAASECFLQGQPARSTPLHETLGWIDGGQVGVRRLIERLASQWLLRLANCGGREREHGRLQPEPLEVADLPRARSSSYAVRPWSTW